MSIIAYASAESDPIEYPLQDPVVDLSTASLPASVTVYGAAVDSSNPSATFSWQWTLLDPASGPVLSSTTTQNITISNIDSWRNIRLHLVATNTATGLTSESNVLLAPSSSFVEVRVLSEYAGIQKVAKGSRAWQEAMYTWANAIEGARGAETLALGDLSDVSVATGPLVDTLVGGGSAVNGSGGALHTHTGAHVANATTSATGVVRLAEAYQGAGAPMALTQERVTYTGCTDLSVNDSKTGVVFRYIRTQSAGAPSEILPHLAFYAQEEVYVTGVHVVLLDGGTVSGAAQYTFDLVQGNAAALAGAALVPLGLELEGTISTNHAPLVINADFSPIKISAGKWFGLGVLASPTLEADCGHGLQVTIHARRYAE
jgi:hypothetical protein